MEATTSTELLIAKQCRGPIVALSEAWAEITGVEIGVLLKTPWQKLVHPDDVAMLQRWVEELRSQGPLAPVRARIRTRDGSYRFIAVEAISDEAGDLLIGTARALAAGPQQGDGILQIGEIVLDTRARTVTASGHVLRLTVSEFELLKLLVSRRGTVLATDDIAREIWGYQSAGSANFLQAHVSRLRRKLREAGAKDPISTVRGVGYIVH